MKRAIVDLIWKEGTPGHTKAMQGQLYRDKLARLEERKEEALRLRHIHAGAAPLPRGFTCFS